MQICKILITFLLVAVVYSSPSRKVEPKLAATLKGERLVNIFVKFQGGNTPAIQRSERLRFGSRDEQTTYLVESLKSLSKSSQQNALSLLRARSPYSAVKYKQIWATNELYVESASSQLINQFAALPEVEEIREELVVSLKPIDHPHDTNVSQWNIQKIEAHLAWKLPQGNNGKGVVVANIDTGVRATHKALRDSYRAIYGWFDPYFGSENPNDSNGHGTHTMGTLVGSGGIGVAPGAKWIACKGCNDGRCYESALKACGQWTLCPTLANGESRNCSLAPRVVSNSWGGGQGNLAYNGMIAAWKAANIVPVFAIGNSGPYCRTANSPGDQDVIAVGSTTAQDSISEFSSAGPSIAGVIKPDISAPGSLVRSAWSTSDTSYLTISGSSMATPHVAGVVALILSQNPDLTYFQVRDLLINNADQGLVDTGRFCGGIPSTQFPNNQYGHGRLNARKTLEAAINVS